LQKKESEISNFTKINKKAAGIRKGRIGLLLIDIIHKSKYFYNS
jgi:hypothetical protein